MRGTTSPLGHFILGLVALLYSGILLAQAPVAYISIIIDDMGDQRERGEDVLALPGPITYAFLPHTPYSQSQARQAYQAGKEVMLHLPMQAMGANQLGPGALTLDMDREQFSRILQRDLAAIPHVVGVNNHMGSLLTRHPGHMQWLMEELKANGQLYFIDSRTTHHTVAARLARENNIPSHQRDVFLDDDPDIKAIQAQFERLIQKALSNGQAIGIGHPYVSTARVLRAQLPRLARLGIKLVPASQILRLPRQRLAQPAAHHAETLVYNQYHPQTNRFEPSPDKH